MKLTSNGEVTLTAQGVVTAAQKARSLDDLADTVVERVDSLRDAVVDDEKFRKAIGRPAAAAPIQRGTRDILREILRAMVINRTTKLDRNHGIDLMHAVVPISYADFVLLDAHWVDQVERVRQRFQKAGLSVPMARVFSKKAGGVDGFLAELDDI